MRSDIRLIEDLAAFPVDPSKVGVGQFRTATDGSVHEIVARRKVGSTTVRALSALGDPVEAPTGADLIAVALGTCVVKDGTGRFVVAGANAADVYFLEKVLFRGATQFARAVRGDEAVLGVGRAGAAIVSTGLPLRTDAFGLLVPAVAMDKVVAISESIQTAPGGQVIVTTETYVL